MSSKVKVVLIIITMFLVLGCVVAGMYFLGNKEYDKVITNKDVNGFIYTERIWEWTPQESRKLLEYVSTENLDKSNVPLHIEKSKFVDIEIPNCDIINDYGKTIWAVDGSFMIRVIGNVNKDTLAGIAGIDNPTQINETTICTNGNTKGKKTIARLVDNYCILADVYVNNSTYSIIRDSLSNENLSIYEHINKNYKSNANKLDELIYKGQFCSQLSSQEISLSSHRYLFEDGFLWEQSNVIPFYTAEEQYISKLEKLSGNSIEEYYMNGQLLYAKAGDYYLGLVAYNSNTTLSYIGKGDEAFCNIASLLNQLQ